MYRVPVNKINSYQIYGLPRNVAERARRVAPRYFAPRCRRDRRRRRRRRPRVLTGRADTPVDVVSPPGYLCLELVFPPELHTRWYEDAWRMVEGKKRVRAGRDYGPRGRRRARGTRNFNTGSAKTFRGGANPLSKLSARLGVFLDLSSPPSFILSLPLFSSLFRSFFLALSSPTLPANARNLYLLESDIAKIYATSDRVSFDTFPEMRSFLFARVSISRRSRDRTCIFDYAEKRSLVRDRTSSYGKR